jgi:hypothetical protein
LAKATTRIDDNDHVCRHVRPALLDIDPDTEEVRGVFNAAFHLKPTDEGELSVNHLEHYPGSIAEQAKAVMLAKKASGFDVRNKSAFAVVQAGEITEAGKKVGLSLASYKAPYHLMTHHMRSCGGYRRIPVPRCSKTWLASRRSGSSSPRICSRSGSSPANHRSREG